MKLSYMEQINTSYLEKSVLQDVTHIAKCIYNLSLYHQRKFYRESSGKYLDKESLYQTIRDGNRKLYNKLNSWVSQRAVYKVDRDYQSFFEHLKVRKPNEIIKPPYYKERGLAGLDFAGPALQVTETTVRLALSNYLRNKWGLKFLTFELPEFVKGKEILEVSVIPKRYGRFDIKYAYNEPASKKVISKESLGLDLGVNNLAACLSTNGDAFLFSGRWIKSVNQFFNKRAAKLQKLIAVEKHPMKKLKLLEKKFRLTKKRNRIVKDAMHKISYNVVNFCKERGLGKIVIGHNIGWKDGVNLGGKTNQNFVQIPHSQLIAYIKYKAKRCGIDVEIVEESYTSKCDGLALEPLQHHTKYLGKRVKRGLFQSSTGKLVNSDIQGALNILRKSIGDSCVSTIADSGGVFLPWHFKKDKNLLNPQALPL